MAKQVQMAYQQAKKRLFLLDYDGTLVPFKSHPSLAKPTPALLALLQKLASDPRNHIVIISGRDQLTLDAWLGQLPLSIVAEHGSFVRPVGQGWQAVAPRSDVWKHEVRPLLDAAASQVAASFVEEKSTALVWHYRLSTPQAAAGQIAWLGPTLTQNAKKYHLLVLHGLKILEVRIGNVTKGTAATTLLQQQPWDFICAAGDDITDEDLFKALPQDAYTFKIGSGVTAANTRLPSCGALIKLLHTLV